MHFFMNLFSVLCYYCFIAVDSYTFVLPAALVCDGPTCYRYLCGSPKFMLKGILRWVSRRTVLQLIHIINYYILLLILHLLYR